MFSSSAPFRRLEAEPEHWIRPGLVRVRKVLKTLGNPHLSLRVIHVAGTNGKGSVCALMESVLRRAGLTPGLYTSPHLVRLEERIQIGGKPVSRAALGACLRRAYAAERRAGVSLSYFERLTAAAFLHFRQRRPEIVILETGMGGRLDATNVHPKPLACVITSIGLDHTQWLGTTLSRIAGEKGGILKTETPVFSNTRGAAGRVIQRLARRKSAPCYRLGREYRGTLLSTDWRRGVSTVRLTGHAGRSRVLKLGLIGAHQTDNAAAALAALEGIRPFFPWSERHLREGFRTVRWPGRLETLRAPLRRPLLVADGAHNPDGFQALAKTLRRSPWPKAGRTLWWAAFSDKDVTKMAETAARTFGKIVLQRLDGPRFASPRSLRRAVLRQNPNTTLLEAPDLRRGLALCGRVTAPRGVVVASGSLRWIGILKDHLK